MALREERPKKRGGKPGLGGDQTEPKGIVVPSYIDIIYGKKQENLKYRGTGMTNPFSAQIAVVVVLD